ncbi:MAG TPA: VOC family protein [Planctomycetota bacterium]|nr:VOC family protein [Planctomycetota bacterium]
MSETTRDRHPSIIPGLRYADAPAAIEWLCEAFGFEAKLVVPGEEEGAIAHAQLVLGNGMIMLGSAGTHAGSAFDEAMRPPSELGGRCTQGAYAIVDDADAHHARARAAGAEILLALEDQDYGGRGYTCRDPQGHVWSFGTYDPWADE